ncbi:hypothetical protein CF8_0155 [Aeromonas phage CF8]|nr:hypothetical protein CF8_0155 [Aeromonas phage CF8]
MQLCSETLGDIKNDIIAIILNAFLNKEMIRTKVCVQGEDYQIEITINVIDHKHHCVGDVIAEFTAAIRYPIPETTHYGPEVMLGSDSYVYRKANGAAWVSEFSDVFATKIVGKLSNK